MGIWFASLLACAVSLLPAALRAAETLGVVTTHATATLISDVDQVSDGRAFHAALRLRLAPGWHTYWINPGDAGLPPNLTTELSSGGTSGPIDWPFPQRVSEGTLTTFAYTGDVILPFVVTPGPGPLTMAAHAEWLVCKDLCIPEEANLRLQLPAGIAMPSKEAPALEAALARTPVEAPFDSRLSVDGVLTLSGPGIPPGVRSADLLPLTPGKVDRAPARVLSAEPGTVRIQLAAKVAPDSARDSVLALTTESGAVSVFAVAPRIVAAPASHLFLVPLLVAALAGGLLLNLMPCVFPILAMKAMPVARLSDADLPRLRRHVASYVAGVVVSFVGLGAGLVLARGAGSAVGWGVQFQSPLFVTAIAWLLFAVGLSFSGVFTVGEALMGRGESLAGKPGHLGSFLTGVLAVVVASPCTAPFMGTALAGALTLPAMAALPIFALLGVGLAAPYAALAFMPGLARLLPRPGRWMLVLQQFLAFPMYAGAVWLLWVVSQQAGPAGVLVTGAGAVAVGLAAWLCGTASSGSRQGHLASRVGLVGTGAALALLLFVEQPGDATKQTFEPFTTARLDALRAAGQPVFVNMTASWCLSCLVNEQIALSRPAVQQALARSHTVYLKGDWTNRNPDISAFLQGLGRDGVPLYALFEPGRPPEILPEILSEGTILDALAARS